MYNAWLDLFIKLPCFGLFREGQREGAAWEAAAFCKGLFNYLPGDWLHGHPVHLGDAPRVRVRGGRSAQRAKPEPQAPAGVGQRKKDASQKQAWGGQTAREGPLLQVPTGRGGG